METAGFRCESDELRPGDVLGGKYLLLQPIAAGGMGRVWVARNLVIGCEVAAKVLLPAYASREGIARFRREAEATATLTHRAIVRVFDLVELYGGDGSVVMVMELLRGHTLAHRLNHTGPLSVDDTLKIALPILSALTHAHQLGIVHRDLKPENVFLAVDPDGQWMPKLVDFGISKQLRASPITQEGEIVGTINYMSPEQTLGGAIDARSDVFAMGVLLYECLSGSTPYGADLDRTRPHDLLSIFDVEPAPLAYVPRAVWLVVKKALSRRAEDRYGSAAELAHALSDAVLERRPRPRTARTKWLRASLGAMALCLAVGVVTMASVASTGSALAATTSAATAREEHLKHVVAGIDYVRAAPAPESPARAPSVRRPSAKRTFGFDVARPSTPVLVASTGTGFVHDPEF